jgi:hypothetical protein
MLKLRAFLWGVLSINVFHVPRRGLKDFYPMPKFTAEDMVWPTLFTTSEIEAAPDDATRDLLMNLNKTDMETMRRRLRERATAHVTHMEALDEYKNTIDLWYKWASYGQMTAFFGVLGSLIAFTLWVLQ